MKALITGITGFVGSHLAELLLASGDEVLGCSQSGKWPADVPVPVQQKIFVFPWDVTGGVTNEASRYVGQFAPDVIYHLAAISVPSDCGADQPTLNAISTNVAGTRTVISLATSCARRPRLLFASSCYVYGTVAADDPVVTEDSPCRPVHGYGITKLAAERELLLAADEKGLDVVIARAFQHSGTRQSPQMILPDWARQIATKQPTIHVICLDTYLDITDVRDVVRAYRDLCVCGRSQMVYNVGSGICRRAGDLLEWMLRDRSADGCVIELSPGRRQHPIADITRITTDTKWQPVIPIHKTLGDILTFWQEQEQGT